MKCRLGIYECVCLICEMKFGDISVCMPEVSCEVGWIYVLVCLMYEGKAWNTGV